MKKLTFITGNPAKAKYLGNYFHIPVDHIKLDLPEIQSTDLQEIVEDKAKRAFEIIKSPVIVEDVSLVFHEMKSLPGPLIKWFLEALGNEGLCKLVSGFGSKQATAKVMFAICDDSGVHTFAGSMSGSIADTPRGEMGFGWDPIFMPDGFTKTWAEMTDDEKHNTSMRRQALEKMSEFLSSKVST